MTTVPIPRRTVAASLSVGGVLSVVSMLLLPPFDGGADSRLQAVAEAGTTGALSAHLFTLAQLPFVIGLVGVAAVLRGRVPVLAGVAAVLAMLGGFGHAVHGGVSLTTLDMAARPTSEHGALAAVLEAGENATLVPYMALGLLGTVLGLILVAIALWRSRLAPRWLSVVLVAFVVVEFGASGLSAWAGYASGALYLAGMVGLALLVLRLGSGEAHDEQEAVVALGADGLQDRPAEVGVARHALDHRS